MDAEKRRRLQKQGWMMGGFEEFLRSLEASDEPRCRGQQPIPSGTNDPGAETNNTIEVDREKLRRLFRAVTEYARHRVDIAEEEVVRSGEVADAIREIVKDLKEDLGGEE